MDVAGVYLQVMRSVIDGVRVSKSPTATVWLYSRKSNHDRPTLAQNNSTRRPSMLWLRFVPASNMIFISPCHVFDSFGKEKFLRREPFSKKLCMLPPRQVINVTFSISSWHLCCSIYDRTRQKLTRVKRIIGMFPNIQWRRCPHPKSKVILLCSSDPVSSTFTFLSAEWRWFPKRQKPWLACLRGRWDSQLWQWRWKWWWPFKWVSRRWHTMKLTFSFQQIHNTSKTETGKTWSWHNLKKLPALKASGSAHWKREPWPWRARIPCSGGPAGSSRGSHIENRASSSRLYKFTNSCFYTSQIYADWVLGGLRTSTQSSNLASSA